VERNRKAGQNPTRVLAPIEEEKEKEEEYENNKRSPIIYIHQHMIKNSIKL
jgi:hypothetical protein